MVSDKYQLLLGDCREVLPTLDSGSIDAVICDPPYPCIKRSYGYWTEEEWFALMKPVVRECRRVLKPTGSAVFVLQPNSERLGRMRPWLWDFMGWVCREWGMVQDAWWWNTAAITEAHSIQGKLLRPSIKACVWAGEPNCWRNQDSVLWQESESNVALRAARRCENKSRPSGHHFNAATVAASAAKRGGVTPFNVLPISNNWKQGCAGIYGHGAGTPLALCDWWTRYIVPPGGTILDPFAGTATTGIAALKRGCDYIGIESKEEYVAIARKRLAEVEIGIPIDGKVTPPTKTRIVIDNPLPPQVLR